MDLSSPTSTATRVRLRARFGSDADTWWSGLPSRLSELTGRWDLNLDEPVGSGNTSLVVRCHHRQRPAILKLTPDPQITRAEAAALRIWRPSGRVPEVYGEADGALLLEAMPSETTLADAGSAAPLGDVAALIRALHDRTAAEPGSAASGPTADAFRPQAERTDLLFGLWRRRAADDPDRVAALDRGHALVRELAAAPPRVVLVHGDLHPGNVLRRGGSELIAIDPRPCLADPASDAVDWVVREDPARWRGAAGELAELIDVEQERLWAWCRAFAAQLAITDGDPRRRQAFRDIAV